MNKKYIAIIVGIATVATVGGTALAMTASAATSTAAQTTSGQHKGGVRKPGVMGTVSAVNGNSITVTSKKFTKGATGTTPTATTVTYTVDATNATVTKSGAASTVSAIAVGDTIMVQGTVSGTSVTATAIRDGVMTRTPGTFGATGAHTKNGVMGTVSAISGNSITVTSKARPNRGSSATATVATPVTYTVDASSATVTKSGTASSVSAVAVGDTIMVRGTVSGTNVTAKTIMDGMPHFTKPAPASASN